jgi:hypothetical protein
MRACATHSGLCGLQVYQPAALAVGRGLADEDSAEGASAQRPGGNVKVFGPSRVYEFCERNGIEVIVTPQGLPGRSGWLCGWHGSLAGKVKWWVAVWLAGSQARS